ncbi:glycerate kinase [Paenibacillus sp. D51F]
MRIIIAPDSFKGSLSAKEAAFAIKAGIRKVLPESAIFITPMADGGEGTMDCLVEQTNGTTVSVTVLNPLGLEIRSGFGVSGDTVTCIIELAMASGLFLIGEEERNPMLTTTYGFGQLIRAGLDSGCRKFILGLGGSATNDGGAGMLQALGAKLLDKDGKELPYGGGSLGRLAHIDLSDLDPRLKESTFTVACDVDNPFIGPNGASYVFGPQKGANAEMVDELDRNLHHYADILKSSTGVAIHDVPGAGAAGGVAGAIIAVLGGKLQSGFDIVAETTNLEEYVQGSDLVITGEGQTDFQTARGKTPCGVARIARKHGVPVIVLSGSIGKDIDALYQEGVHAVISIMNRPMSLSEAMEQAAELLEQQAEQLIRIYTIGR